MIDTVNIVAIITVAVIALVTIYLMWKYGVVKSKLGKKSKVDTSLHI